MRRHAASSLIIQGFRRSQEHSVHASVLVRDRCRHALCPHSHRRSHRPDFSIDVLKESHLAGRVDMLHWRPRYEAPQGPCVLAFLVARFM
jgi:hypothetical protein